MSKVISSMFRNIVSLLVCFCVVDANNNISVSSFQIFWNVPSQICNYRFGVPINVTKWGIIQNTDDNFYGDKVTIIYGPGQFPYMNGSVSVYGGIPQRADISGHLDYFRKQVETRVPKGFQGPAVLDFEGYQPIFYASRESYRNESIAWAKQTYPKYPIKFHQIAAEVGFENGAKMLFQSLLTEGARLRPKALWGYYHYPYCQNPTPGKPQCHPNQVIANEAMNWLFKSSGAYYPSIYVYKNGWSTENRRKQVAYRLQQALHIREINSDDHKPIMPYFWFKYHDDVETFISRGDIKNTIMASKIHFKLNGTIIWGSSNDVMTKKKCLSLQNFVNDVLGPTIVSLS